MKKRNLVTYLGLASLVLGSLWSVPVGADADKKSDVSITFNKPSSSDKLQDKSNIFITQVPTFSFGSNDFGTSDMYTYEDSEQNEIIVSNNNGDSSGYKITAKTNGLIGNQYGKSLKASIDEYVKDSSEPTLIGGKITGANNQKYVNINTENLVATGNPDANGEVKSGKTGLKLTMNRNDGIKADTYSGTIDYTLTRGQIK
ncbi:hypothetical protein R4B61_02550 [Fructilactobacillus vespulae]|uniref:hypothetical protein n=1 Tax=Fructilactobacillus vespulae TaxID=1249630 RepID=UPI0039B5D9BC